MFVGLISITILIFALLFPIMEGFKSKSKSTNKSNKKSSRDGESVVSTGSISPPSKPISIPSGGPSFNVTL